MNTKRFQIEFKGANYNFYTPHESLELVAVVTTDYASHRVRQYFERDGKPKHMYAEQGRTYTPHQTEAVKELFAYYRPTVIGHALKWMEDHNFDPTKDNVSINMDNNFRINRASYNGAK